MENPFEMINQRLDTIENTLNTLLSKFENTKDGSTPTFMTIDQFCEHYNYKKSTVYGLVHKRKIPHSKVGKRLYFEKTKINNWIREKHVSTESELEEKANEYLSNNRFK